VTFTLALEEMKREERGADDAHGERAERDPRGVERQAGDADERGDRDRADEECRGTSR
jgi:hypothetical protein